MEPTNTENITYPSTKAAVQPTDTFLHDAVEEEEEDEGPSVSSQPVINQSLVNQVRTTNTHTLELPVLLLFFSWNLSGTVFQNQVLYQSCILKYNETTCNLLANEDIPDDLEVIFHVT